MTNDRLLNKSAVALLIAAFFEYEYRPSCGFRLNKYGLDESALDTTHTELPRQPTCSG